MKPVFRKLVLDSLRPLQSGSLEVVFPDGRVQWFGGLDKSLPARIEIRDEAFFKRCVLFGAIGFAESYIDGEWETPNLVRVIAFFILNADSAAALDTDGGAKSYLLNLLNAYNRVLHKRRPNSVAKARENIRDHYDLSNDFFKLWLDPTMTYSAAVFDPAGISLEEAQIRKYDLLCRKLQLGPADHVLEIGTGWGGFAIHAARTYGCRVSTITISEAQLAEAQLRIEQAGLRDRIDARIEDYRNVRGQFDKIVSIEMIEAVGDQYLDEYFECCHRLLKPRGLLALQMISCPDRQFRILRDGVDFIQKHIFPGSLLVSQARVTQAVNRTGTLNLLDWDDLSPHYARTLKLWAERFEEQREAVLALGFDEGFLRKWRYYLRYCEAAFGTRHIASVQAVYTRPDNISIRSDVYDLAS
ncbi:MAG TPA: cyclopropane-fatty-acyl-phospholipid synthase family protein [Chthoniobacterales bacterium]|nr:cyclopropane-fatty-acyl-phospholipid synthase family protein [Chthoniobacterales bacterium]